MDDGDAAYAELAYAGKQRIFMDDRYDMFPTRVIYDFFALSNGSSDWKRVMEKYDVETVVMEKGQPLVEYLRQSGDWTQVHQDKTWVALVRNDVR